MLSIKEIERDVAEQFVFKYHYSKIMPRITKYYLGIFDKELLGVVTLGYGTQPLQTIKKILPNHDLITTDYIEIGKMCFVDSVNNDKSFGSRSISLLVKWIKQNLDVKFLYTLADGIMGKPGYVYQASNFVYIGDFQTQVYRDDKTGEKIHPRSSKDLLKENEKLSGKKMYWLSHDFCELNDISLRILNSYNFDLPYPKDKDLQFWVRVEKGRFELTQQPTFNMDVFNFNYQHKGKEY